MTRRPGPSPLRDHDLAGGAASTRQRGRARLPRRGSAAFAILRPWILITVLACPAIASAFTFSDGSEMSCVTADGVVGERFHPVDDPTAPKGFVGFTHRDDGAGWVIEWNLLLLSSAPDAEHDFAFFHECAHAKSGTLDELTANCLGLIDMRAAGRAGRAVEARLTAYHRRQGYLGPEYGLARDFWARTLACAGGARRAPA